MQNTGNYESPIGKILIACREDALTGLWFENQKYYARTLDAECVQRETPLLARVRTWLDIYFSGDVPDFSIPLRPGGTAFQKIIWNILLTIPRGHTITYGQIAVCAAKQLQRPSMSAQAVGSAVGHNPISILVPCHRVIGADSNLTGYAGGIDRKQYLLSLEGAYPVATK